MKLGSIIIIIILLSNIAVYCQTESSQVECCLVDENGEYQGYWKLPDGFNLVYKEKVVKGIEAWGSGYYRDSKRVGTWEFTDDKGKLLGYRIYDKEENYVEVQLRNKKPLSIIIFKKISENKEKQADIYQITEILSFNKRGRFINRNPVLQKK